MRAQQCKNCIHYTAYHKKLPASYCRLTNGFCSKHDKQQSQSETFESFVSNEQKEKRDEFILFHSLECALKSIDQIAQILKEKEEDNQP